MSATSYFTVCDPDEVPGCVAVKGEKGDPGEDGEDGEDGAPGATIGVFVRGSVALAKAIPSASTNVFLAINGDLTGGDGVTHSGYVWDNASTAAGNDGSILEPTDAGVGRWLQVF